jgi:oligosaccharide repeat unit polymerase
MLLFIIFFWIVVAQIQLNGGTHLFTLFLGIFFVYLLGLPFFNLLGWINLDQQILTVPVHLSNTTLITVYTYTSFFLMLVFLGVLFGYKSKNYVAKLHEVAHNKFLYQCGLLLFLYALPGSVIKYYMRYQLFVEKGYLAGYDGSVDAINFPIICFGASAILTLGYCFILSSHPSRKQFLIISGVFLLTQLLNAAKGQRMNIIFPVIFVFWFYTKLYVKQLSIKNIVYLMLGLIILSQVMAFYRGDKTSKKSFIGDYVSSFFVEQGITFKLLPNQIELDRHIKNTSYPYIVNSLVPHGKNTFGVKYMQYVAPEAYKQGYGVGDSIVLQFYDLPYIVSAVLCFLLGFIMERFEKLMMSRRFLLFSSYYFLFAVLIVRYDLLGKFYTWLVSAVIWMIITNIYKVNKYKLTENYKNITT